MRRRKIWAALFLLAASSAHAEQRIAAWSTYLRSGPGDGYSVLDEVRHDDPVDVQSCSGRWCAVRYGRASGYVDADSLRGAIPVPQTDGRDCAWSTRPGFDSPRRAIYCPGTPPPG
jgi:uncharacterized protein YraI